MLRIYSRNWDGIGPLPELDREENHHLVRVRRVRIGEEVEVLNGRGVVGLFEVLGLNGKTIEFALKDLRQEEPHPLQTHLLVSLPKGKVFPNLLHKAVELGVSEITPLLTDHTEADARRLNEKADRWESILIEGVKQSGNPWMPKLNEISELKDVLGQESRSVRLCAALQPGARPLWRLLGDPLEPQGRVEMFVGPEGDFSVGEYTLLRDSGCHFVSLGPLVLKVETAASLLAGTLHLWSLGQS